MTLQAFIELQAIKLDTKIGTYPPGAAHPREHLLSLVLCIDPKLILIEEDSMQNVLDYVLICAES